MILIQTNQYDTFMNRLLAKKGVQKLIGIGYQTRRRLYVLPRIWIVGTCGVNTAGQTWIYEDGQSDIEISSWILVDAEETKRVVKHEFAHTIKEYACLEGKPHGKGYTQALKAVSSQQWRRDKYWHTNRDIDDARVKAHPQIRATSKQTFTTKV